MASEVNVGLALIGAALLGLFIEYIWREVAGRPTRSMIIFYALMQIPMSVGLYMASAHFQWALWLRLAVGAIGGLICFHIGYFACGIVYHIIIAPFRR